MCNRGIHLMIPEAGQFRGVTRQGSAFMAAYALCGKVHRFASGDLLHWHGVTDPDFRAENAGKNDHPIWSGDVMGETALEADEGEWCVAWGKRALSIPAFRAGGVVQPSPTLSKLRIWKREWEKIPLTQLWQEALRFRIKPGIWPDIQLEKGDGTCEDVQAPCFEVHLSFLPGADSGVNISLCGQRLRWEAGDQALYAGGHRIPLPKQEGAVAFRCWIDAAILDILAAGRMWHIELTEQDPEEMPVANNMTGNVSFAIPAARPDEISLFSDGKTATLVAVQVYGLRSVFASSAVQRTLLGAEKGALLYQAKSFRVYERCVEDDGYGEPAAWTPDSATILSPPRAVEEFAWRKNPWGDMTRAVNRKEYWRPSYLSAGYPSLTTGVTIVDCAYRLAMDVLSACTEGDYAYPGQEGMWSAGMFQGKGEGFGVWLRDSTHIALRGGNLLDRENARRTLRFTAKSGIDNGCDGHAMPAVGLWDYYMATGDRSLLVETWPDVLRHMEEAEKLYCANIGLVQAPQSTSNDAFPEPESGGYCLSTEIYYMDAFRSAAKIARLLQQRLDLAENWDAMAGTMKGAIRSSFWNEGVGFYTSGPYGSKAFQGGHWETSGEEAAIWQRFSIADCAKRRQVLDCMGKTAMTEFGLDLFPHRQDSNHFCHSVWNVWNAGFAEAANAEHRDDIVNMLLGQQIRTCIMNKTFYEVVDCKSGIAWRWPGQLWQAMGFASTILYGLLGIRYDENCLTIAPCLPCWADTLSFFGLRYRDAVLDITVRGRGTKYRQLLNGDAMESIPGNLHGAYTVYLTAEGEAR